MRARASSRVFKVFLRARKAYENPENLRACTRRAGPQRRPGREERRGRVRDLDRKGLTAQGGPSAAGVPGDNDSVRLLPLFRGPELMGRRPEIISARAYSVRVNRRSRAAVGHSMSGQEVNSFVAPDPGGSRLA